jgi:hypothetical protein
MLLAARQTGAWVRVRDRLGDRQCLKIELDIALTFVCAYLLPT